MAMALLLALGLVFTSCKQPDPDADMTEDELKDTEWLIGKWEKKYEVDYEISGIEDDLKKAFEEQYKEGLKYYNSTSTEKIEITRENVANFAKELESYIKNKEGKEDGFDFKVSIKINKDKTRISIYMDGKRNIPYSGKQVELTVQHSIIYTKK